jgi:hypothetical protein
MDITYTILDNASSNVPLRAISTDIHAFNAQTPKFGMEQTVLIDALMENLGSMEAVFVRMAWSGMDIIVLLVMEVKFGIQQRHFVHAQTL